MDSVHGAGAERWQADDAKAANENDDFDGAKAAKAEYKASCRDLDEMVSAMRKQNWEKYQDTLWKWSDWDNYYGRLNGKWRPA